MAIAVLAAFSPDVLGAGFELKAVAFIGAYGYFSANRVPGHGGRIAAKHQGGALAPTLRRQNSANS